MLGSIKSCLAGIRSHIKVADITADNISNINTTAFKATHVSFADLPYNNLEIRRFPVIPGENNLFLQGGTGARVNSSTVSLTQGDLVDTGRSFDLAIEGEGFFRVVFPDGRIAYSRDGNFQLDAEGNLTTFSGARLEPLLYLTGRGYDPASLEVTSGGIIRVVENELPIEQGRISLYRFANPAGMERIGAGMFQPTVASGGPQPFFPGEEGVGLLHQRYLESSNVNIASETINLLKAQRGMQSSARALVTADELWAMVNYLQR